MCKWQSNIGAQRTGTLFPTSKPQAMNSVSFNGIPSVANAYVEDCQVRSSLFTDLLFSVDSLGKVKGCLLYTSDAADE